MSSVKRVTLMFSVNVSRLSQTLPNEVLNAPSKELITSGFGLTSLSTSLAFGYFLFSTLCNVLLISNNNEFIAHVCWSKKRVHCMAVVYIRRHPGKKYMFSINYRWQRLRTKTCSKNNCLQLLHLRQRVVHSRSCRSISLRSVIARRLSLMHCRFGARDGPCTCYFRL